MTTSDSLPARLADLVDRAAAADGSPPFSDGALVALAQGGRTLVELGSAVAVVGEGEAEFVVDPDARRRGEGGRILDRLIAEGSTLFWAHGDHPGARALAASRGLTAVRTLLHLEAAVPGALEGEGVVSAAADWQEPWLALNARAFASHPEQGAVTRADLDVLTAEPWFDPADVLLLWDGDELIGSCWLKGDEFYVVAVAPERQGEGLGRRLIEAGLARLAEKGILTAHLYVEGDNAPALALYRAYGFTPRSVDVQYRFAPSELR